MSDYFSAFSPLNGGAIGTYGYPTESPYDLDAGLDYTRKATGFAMYPFPVVLGWVEGLLPMSNSLEFQIMLGRVPFGPWEGEQSAPNTMVFPNIMGSMMKVSG